LDTTINYLQNKYNTSFFPRLKNLVARPCET